MNFKGVCKNVSLPAVKVLKVDLTRPEDGSKSGLTPAQNWKRPDVLCTCEIAMLNPEPEVKQRVKRGALMEQKEYATLLCQFPHWLANLPATGYCCSLWGGRSTGNCHRGSTDCHLLQRRRCVFSRTPQYTCCSSFRNTEGLMNLCTTNIRLCSPGDMWSGEPSTRKSPILSGQWRSWGIWALLAWPQWRLVSKMSWLPVGPRWQGAQEQSQQESHCLISLTGLCSALEVDSSIRGDKMFRPILFPF